MIYQLALGVVRNAETAAANELLTARDVRSERARYPRSASVPVSPASPGHAQGCLVRRFRLGATSRFPPPTLPKLLGER